MRKKFWIVLSIILLSSGMLLTSCAPPPKIPSESTVSPQPDDAERARIEAEIKAEEEARRRAEESAAEEEAARRKAEEEAAKIANEHRRLMAEQYKFENTPIYFEYNQSVLSDDARELLKNKSEWLKKNPSVSIIIEGHCDERGSTEYNQALGERRAKITRGFLMDLGISGIRIKTVSYGEERPAILSHDEESWSKNRRAEFKIID